MKAQEFKIKPALWATLFALTLSACGGSDNDTPNADVENSLVSTSETSSDQTDNQQDSESPELSENETANEESVEGDASEPVVSSIAISDITGGVAPQELVDALLGPESNVQVSNIVMSGDARCAGLFSSLDGGAPGFDEGVILSTGTAVSAAGPNISDETTTEFFTPGDAFLDSLLVNEITFDACVLEFDFVCEGANQVRVDYVMGSEEYNEFVEEGVNDVFGFGLNNVNIATIPNSGGLPVTIGNLNCGDPYDPNAPTTPNTPFCDLFNNNDLQDGGPFFNIEADGFTDVLRAEAELQPGINHFKFAVGDTIDQAFDTWVFIRSGSFQCNVPDVTPKNITLLSSKRSFSDSEGNRYANEDIVRYDPETQEFQQYFDGSDMGLGHANVDAFITLESGDILISLSKDKVLQDFGKLKDEDIVRFKPASLGEDTSGTFEPFFVAEENGLVCEDKKEEPPCGCTCPCDCGESDGKKHKGGDVCTCDCQCKMKGDTQSNSCETHKKPFANNDFLAEKGDGYSGYENDSQNVCSCERSKPEEYYAPLNFEKGNKKKCKAIDIDALDVFEGIVTGSDADNDGILNSEDACPLDAGNDADGDGLCGNYILYLSLTESITINGVTFDDEDIIAYEEATGTYSMYFDGSDVGLKKSDVDALKLLENGNILISLKRDAIIDGLGEVSDEDIIVFEPTSLGDETSGIFTMVEIDGSEIGVMSCKDLDFDGVDQLMIAE